MGPRGQPDTLAVHWQFLSRTRAGPAVLRIVEAKTGRAMSVLHMTLHQRGLLSAPPWLDDSPSSLPGSKGNDDGGAQVAAYVTNGNMDAETGITLPTGWGLPHPPAAADLALLPLGRDPSWERMYTHLMSRLPMLNNLEYYKLRKGHERPAAQDLWIRLARSGEAFTDPDLGFVVDAVAAMLVDAYRPPKRGAPTRAPGGFPYSKALWYPTVTLSLEVKKRLPPEGAEWLRLHAWARLIRNGRYDAQLLVFDQHGELVASSSQLALAVDLEKNYANRGELPKHKSKV